MSYEELTAAFLTPRGDEQSVTGLAATPARRLRDAIEPIATIGWWSRAAGDQFEAAGVDFFGGYVWGRAASLGSAVDATVVVSAFGVFEPGLLTAVLDGARDAATQEQILDGRARGAAAGLRAATLGVPLELVTSAARSLRSALDVVAGTGRPLFSGLRSLPIPTDPHGALWRAAEMYREHRGDGNLAASIAAGLDPVEMNVLTELWLGYEVGEYSGTRGFSPDRLQQAVDSLAARGWIDGRQISAAGRAARDEIETATDASQQSVIDAIGESLHDLLADLTVVGDAVLAAHAAPADPRKRAAG